VSDGATYQRRWRNAHVLGSDMDAKFHSRTGTEDEARRRSILNEILHAAAGLGGAATPEDSSDKMGAIAHVE
jgi:hypothetical protein